MPVLSFYFSPASYAPFSAPSFQSSICDNPHISHKLEVCPCVALSQPQLTTNPFHVSQFASGHCMHSHTCHSLFLTLSSNLFLAHHLYYFPTLWVVSNICVTAVTTGFLNFLFSVCCSITNSLCLRIMYIVISSHYIKPKIQIFYIFLCPSIMRLSQYRH